jgi:PGF-CTERM protein
MSRVAAVLVVSVLASLVAVPTGIAAAQSDDTVTLTVSIRDRTGDPIGGAELDATWDGGETTATTASNGKAFVDVPDGAEVRIAVTHPSYLRTSPFVLDDASEREVGITVYRKSTVRLEVTDANGAVTDASVLIERGGLDVAVGTTGAGGVFESDVIQAGDYTVTVTKPGYYDRTKSLTVRGDVTNRVALRPGSVNVTVEVVDPHFDPPRPVSDATVTLDGVATATSSGTGEIRVGAPVNTPTTLSVTKSGYRTVDRGLTVGERDVTLSVDLSRAPSLTIDVVGRRMVAGERILVTATDAYDDPVAGATVSLDGDTVGTTDVDGELAVPVDDPGTHTLRASSDGRTSNELVIEAIAAGGDEPTATPTATRTSTATGTPTESDVSAPGFTAALAVLAVLGAGYLAGRR